MEIAGKTLINDIKLEFKKGYIVGIMGESGKGKSTFVKLIPKFRQTHSIYINGIDINDIKNDEYLKLVSYYSQNTPIITASLYENLNFGRKEVPKDEYRKLSFLDKFDNFDEEIIEGGANLSGGDKQRIAFSRYFTENSKIVILDEPTSSLDKETEVMIIKKVLENSKDKIIFLISHNPELMNYCNHRLNIVDNKIEVVKLK